MKRACLCVLSLLLMLGMTACSPTSENEPETDATAEGEGTTSGSDALVVYFSATGNTESVARTLAQLQSAELYAIVPTEPYTEEDLDYNNESSRANIEQNDENARPQISGTIENIEDYDVIYVGFPIWWGTLLRILCTFFDTYDLSGKTIAPFCTSGSSGIDEAVRMIETLEPDADVREGARIDVDEAESQLNEWLSLIQLSEQ